MKLCALGLVVVACGSWAAEPSVAVKLASIDAGRVLQEGAPQVKRASAALQAAGARCTGKPAELANSAVLITNELLREGHAASAVEVLEGLDAVLVDFDSPVECRRALASYAMNRRNGFTHSRSVVMQRALMKTVAEGGGR